MELMDDARPDRQLIRIKSDYLGAGSYAVAPDANLVYVNTDYGVQALDLEEQERWRVDLIERCLGVTRRPEGELLASTVHALHRIDPDGQVIDTRPTRHTITRAPIAWRDGTLLVTKTRIYLLDRDGEVAWRLRLRESLGESVKDVFTIDVLPGPRCVVAAAVDHDTGVGRVIVLDEDGKIRWQSEPGPVTEIFAASGDEFVYTLSGYGRFESYRANTSGEIRWKRQLGGPGVRLPRDRIAMLIGNNEAPTWDDWELRITDAEGDAVEKARARGRSAHPPVIGSDGALYFSGFVRPFDPAESRVDYTSFVRQPRFVAYDHLWNRPARPEFNVYYFRYEPGGDLELLHEDTDSLALGPTIAGGDHVFFSHGRDLLALRVGD